MTTTVELLAALLAEFPGDLAHWPVSLSLLGLAATMIAARLARGRHWGWHAALGLLVVGILAVPWMAMVDEQQNYECEQEEVCTCPTGCGVPERLTRSRGTSRSADDVHLGKMPWSRLRRGVR